MELKAHITKTLSIARKHKLSETRIAAYAFYIQEFLLFTQQFNIPLTSRAIKIFILFSELTIYSSNLTYKALKFFFEKVLKQRLSYKDNSEIKSSCKNLTKQKSFDKDNKEDNKIIKSK